MIIISLLNPAAKLLFKLFGMQTGDCKHVEVDDEKYAFWPAATAPQLAGLIIPPLCHPQPYSPIA